MTLDIEIEREEDGRWIAEVPSLAGVLAYGATEREARAKAQALALRVLADRLEHGEVRRDLLLRLALSAALVLNFTGATAVSGQALEGYFLGEQTHLPDSLIEAYDSGRISIAITRRAASALERELLQTAEGLVPETGLIEAEVQKFLDRRSPPGVWPEAFAAARAAPGQRWWWREWDGAWLPFAVTGAAVQHYITRARELSIGENPFSRYNPGVEHRVSFTYEAEVTQREGRGLSVRMSIEWSLWCGSLCAVSFRHSRTVDFDSDGNVVSVEGDGAPSYMVS